MKNIVPAIVLHLVSTLLCLTALPAVAQIAVIVNPKNNVALTPEQVGNIFLGKTNALPNGAGATVVDLPETSNIRDMFYARIANKTPEQVKAMRSRRLFTGKGAPPKELSGSQEVRRFVEGNPEAIGYVDKASVDGGVRVLMNVE